jgi:Ras-related protein Rab-2A
LSHNYLFKIIIIGPAAVGKTSLLERFVHNRFLGDYKLTIGVNFLSKKVDVGENGQARLTIWDIGGQERFASMRTEFYKGASGAALVFDLTRMETYNAIDDWLQEVRQYAGNVPFILIGNKADLLGDIGRLVSKEDAQEYARKNNSIYIETSAKTGENVDDAFVNLSKIIVNSLN